MASDNVIPFPKRGSGQPPGPPLAEELVQRLIAETGSPAAAWGMLQELLGLTGPGMPDPFESRQPELLPTRAERACFVVRVGLDDAKPPIWRRLRLASDLHLDQLHGILQVAMGWTDSHLHHFQVAGDGVRPVAPFLTAFDIEEGEEGILEADVRLDEVIGEPGDRLLYEYDFGDGWRHTIRLEKVVAFPDGEPLARCVAGRRACPPEDVGGIGGYEEVLAGFAGQREGDPDWEERLEWLPPGFDPARFDLDEVNEGLADGPLPALALWHPALATLLARGGGPMTDLLREALAGPSDLTADELVGATRSYRVLLATIGDGLKLTAAGYLPPAVVTSLYTELGMDDWFGKGTREEHTITVLRLRETATALGLLRKANGRLSVTKLGTKLRDDPAALFAHVRSRLPLGRREDEQDAGLIGLLYAAARRPWWEHLQEAAGVFSELGWYTASGSLDLALSHASHPTLDVLEQLCPLSEGPDRRADVARALLRRG